MSEPSLPSAAVAPKPAETALFQIVLSTFPDEDSARRAAQVLVEERWVACANLLPGVTSIYRWQGQVETATEVQVIFKTAAPLEEMMARLKALHPYEVPEMVALPVGVSWPAYCDWVRAESGPLH